MLPRRATLIGLVLLVVAVACGGPSTRLVTVRTPTGSGSIDFTVKNLSSAAINTFYLAKTERVNATGKERVDPNSPEGDALWGPDLSGRAIGTGQSQPIPVPEPGNWDARAVDRDGREQLITHLHLGAGGKYILELNDGGWRVYSN
jgi:hypothetical protein